MVAVMAAVSFVGCGGNGAALSGDFRLNFSEISLSPGKSEQLYAHVDKDVTVIWQTSDNSVVTVDKNGFVTAISIGEAEITATVGKTTKKCVIKVVGASYFPRLELSHKNLSVYAGDTFTVKATVTVGGKTVLADVRWTSDNEEIATVSDGVISGVGAGDTVITAACVYNGES